MIAFIFSMGMLFAFSKSQSDPNNDYVLTSEGVVPIQEIDCGSGNLQCRAQLEQNGPIYKVYDDPSMTIPKVGNGSVTQLF